MPASESGAIADVNLTAFQSSIDELLAAARSKTPSSVLLAMKTVVLATTLVTDDVAKYEQHSGSELSVGDNEQLQSLKAKCSATLNNLMTACRNHASSHGMSPVSLLDAAASHVSTTIVDLVKLLKVRKASKLEAEESEATFTQEGRLQNGLKPLRMDSAATVREASPFSAGSNGTHGGAADLRSRTSTEDRRLNPSSAAAADERFSPRIRASPNLGRYSPIGYRPNTVRKDSNEVTWRARAASVSSTGSGSGLKPTVPASTSSPARSVTHRSNTMTSTRSGGSYQEHVQSDGQDEGEENWAELRVSGGESGARVAMVDRRLT